MIFPEKMITRAVRLVWILSVVLVVYFSLKPRLELPCDFSGADKLAHFAAYGWLGILAFFGFDRMAAALAGALLMIPLGIALEFLQGCMPGREFSIADMVANGAGVVLGIIAARYVKKSFSVGGVSSGACRKILS
ncbi:MAG: hypothetical protein B5M55_00645 [Desulfococcus sp. 4484_242]|nr:MAG: hypothetical protein B5M55_00645 [Desulfococcus sp. 4484_242]